MSDPLLRHQVGLFRWIRFRLLHFLQTTALNE